MVFVSDLVIEFSRKCNMTCEHCLRGDAKKKSINPDIYRQFFRIVSDVGCLTVGGGEPSLAIKEIETFITDARVFMPVTIQNTFLVTNGKYLTRNILETYRRFIEISEDLEISGIGFSFDKWHNHNLTITQQDRRDNNFAKADDYFTYEIGLESGCGPIVRNHSDDKWDYRGLIGMGRAVENGLACDAPRRYEVLIEEDGKDIRFNDVNFYISSNGCLFSDCNLSYDEMDTRDESPWFICDIMKLESAADLLAAVKSYNERILEDECDES